MKKAEYIHGTSPTEQARLAALNELTNDAFIRFLKLHETDHILEVGSGVGILAKSVAKLVRFGYVTGIESSKEQLVEASLQNKASNLKFVEGDAHELPFSDRSFDVVYCRYVLEHLIDPQKAVSEMYRVSKPGAKLFIQENNISMCTFDPDLPTFDSVWKKFAQLQTKLGGDALIGKKLFRFVKKAGFQKIKLTLAPEIHCFGEESFEPWISNLVDNITGVSEQLVKHSLSTQDEIKKAVAELQALKKNEYASAQFHWNQISATAIKDAFGGHG